jgi:lipopolysaccharide/colanic/teichoic acid biosynthesis glycosyltransferase
VLISPEKASVKRIAVPDRAASLPVGRQSKSDQKGLLIYVAFVLGAAALLPFAYQILALEGAPLRGLPAPLLAHLFANCAANVVVMLMVNQEKTERLDQKLGGVLGSALMVHGVFAFAILLGRQPYSNQIMLTSVVLSGLLGSAAMYLRHATTPLKIALIGLEPPPSRLPAAGTPDLVSDPAADLRRYDLLLTTTITDLSPEWAQAISSAMVSGKRVRHIADFIEERQGIVSLEHFDLNHLSHADLTSYFRMKRVLDLCIGVASLPIILPMLAISCAAIILTTGRPVLFIQERTGLKGKPFRMYKLRTMLSDAHLAGAATTNGDARITPVGKVLRKYRIDELPQIFNVLAGDMSIVGPRPEWSKLSDQYAAELPAYHYRSLVRPGITGWAQVKGGYASDLSETRIKVGYDLFYIKNMSLGLDLQILLRTVWTLLSAGGAR